jgi:hypothetical protein
MGHDFGVFGAGWFTPETKKGKTNRNRAVSWLPISSLASLSDWALFEQ